MALFGDFGNILSGVSSVLSTLGGPVGTIGQLGQTFLTAANPAPAVGPTVVAYPQPSVQPVMSQVPKVMQAPGAAISALVRGARKGLSQIAVGALVKIAQITGSRTMSLRRALTIVKRLGKVLEPAAVATALGLTIEELGELILSDAQRTRRRMNPANATALRRAHRRMESFHRLCQKNDTLKTRRRRSTPRTITVCK